MNMMSIERIPPFEQSKDDKSEKGFRDALIMFTILDKIKGRPGDFSLVVTNDVLLTRGLNVHSDEFKTNITVVRNLDQAIVHIDARSMRGVGTICARKAKPRKQSWRSTPRKSLIK